MNIFEDFQNLGKVGSDFEEYQHPLKQDGEFLDGEEKKRNFWPLFLIFFVIFGAILFKLVHLQITHGGTWQLLAEGNRIRSRDIKASRGQILDKNGKLLASNQPSYQLEIYPADLPRQKEERESIYAKIAPILGIDQKELVGKIEGENFFQKESIVLEENIERDKAMLYEMKLANLSGVNVAKLPIRKYEDIPSASHFLGYVGKVASEELKQNSELKMNDSVGKSGIEKVYDDYLRGEDGKNQVEVDSKGRLQRTLATINPIPGDSLYLYLDIDLQNKMTQILEEALKQQDKKAGVALAIDPQNGGILGMVSYPYYDNNLITSGIKKDEYDKLVNDPMYPLFNRAISGVYPSGSTIKPVIAAAGLQEGVINDKTTVNDDKGEIRIGEWVFPDWKAHGLVNVYKAIAQSCNVFFYSVGGGWGPIRGLGAEKLDQYLEKFGFGKKTGIDLDAEALGLVPTPQWKEKVKKEAWYQGDSYHLAIGQGDFLVTPLQLLNSVVTIANGGELLKPQIVKEIRDPQGNIVKQFSKEIVSQNLVDKSNIEIVREAMRQTVTSGSGRILSDLPVTSGAKTGTAQFGSEDKTHAWFVSFAPYDNPSIAVLVLVEEGGEGNIAAAPIANDILKYYFNR